MKNAAIRNRWAGLKYTAGLLTKRWLTTNGSIALASKVMPTKTKMSVGSARIATITARLEPMPP